VIGQFQLDGLGESLELFAAAARLDLLAEENWQAAAMAAEAVEKRWPEPDAGIWELGDRHWTHSRLACVSGLRSLAAAAQGPPGGHGHRQAARWSALADSILASLGDAVHATGRWQLTRRRTHRCRPAAAGDPRNPARGRPAHPRDRPRGAGRAHRGRVRVPVPPRRPAAA
jgi:hypothetical protein